MIGFTFRFTFRFAFEMPSDYTHPMSETYHFRMDYPPPGWRQRGNCPRRDGYNNDLWANMGDMPSRPWTASEPVHIALHVHPLRNNATSTWIDVVQPVLTALVANRILERSQIAEVRLVKATSGNPPYITVEIMHALHN